LILVCGGAGYIGSHTVHLLSRGGFEVCVLDNMQKGHAESIGGFKLYRGELRDGGVLDTVFGENKIDAVVHFAANSLVGESVREPLKYYDNNVAATMNLVSAMLRHNVKKIVFSSTAATYGEPERVPIFEDDRTLPTNPYGETKLAIERMLKWCDAAYGMKSVCLRYFNAAGAMPDGSIGEDHNPETHLIPIILQAALGKRPYIEVFGDDYPTADGTCVRDYIHVIDLADAHILALRHLLDGGDSRIYNLGAGNGYTVRQIIEAARRITGIDIPEKTAGRRPGDPAMLVASSDKIKAELGWEPGYSLDDIISSAWLWHKTHPHGFDGKE
jgi:UDP-glucose 4-epimerase